MAGLAKQKARAKSLVIDVRDNGGGYMEEAMLLPMSY
jgi:C-terminal processing protease CtpA/Prc